MCKCSVKDCDNQAEYLVLLTDYDDKNQDTWVEIDYTCPFLCEKHKQENETKKKTDPNHPRSIDYPHSNKNEATGITKYISLQSINEYKLNKK